MINRPLQNPSYYYLTQQTRHCPTCQCQEHQNLFQWRNQQAQILKPNLRVSQIVHSRVVPAADPNYSQVGENIIPNKTVWMRSVSPRSPRITIRVSSPDRPNLTPSQASTSVHKRSPVQEPPMRRIYQASRVSIKETNAMTPMKHLGQKTLTDINDQSTIYSPHPTQRQINQTINTSLSQY